MCVTPASATSEPYNPDNLLDRLTTWRQSRRQQAGCAAASSIQMIRRDAIDKIADAAPATASPATAARPSHARADAAHPDQPAVPRFAATSW